MLMALQPDVTPMTELDRGVQPGIPIRDQLTQVLIESTRTSGPSFAPR